MQTSCTLFDAIFEPDDLVEIRLLPSGQSQFHPARELVAIECELRELNRRGQNIHFGANPRSRNGRKAADVALARCLYADFDNCDPAHALQRMQDRGLPAPTAAVASGHGLHVYFRLAEPIADLDAFRGAQKRLIGLLGSDPAVHDPPRCMRLPGFRNLKAPPADCELLDADPTRRYDLAQIIGNGAPPLSVSEALLRQAVTDATYRKRNQTGFDLARDLRDRGFDLEHVEAVMRRYAAAIRHTNTADDAALSEPYTEEEALRTARSVFTHEPRPRVDAEDVPDPEIVSLVEADLPEIPADVLPTWARDYALALSDAKETPLALAVLLTLPTLASCVQRAYIVRIHPSYAEVLCLYTAPALGSGERKTAVQGPLVGPLFDVQKTLRADTAKERKDAEQKCRLIKEQIKALEREHAKADTHAQGEIEARISALAETMPPIPSLPQVLVEDFTEAALGVALTGNGESLLVTSDEGGLFDRLAGRYTDAPEIDLFLKSHVGSPYLVNRIGRENIYLQRPLLSVAISPQPDVLSRLTKAEGFIGRGLTARFLWALPKSNVGARRLDPARIDPTVSRDYYNGVIAMTHLGRNHAGDPAEITLSRDAYELWREFERELEPRIGECGDLRPIKPWASKLLGAIARIAGVCHAGRHLQRAADTPIDGAAMEDAIDLGRSLIPHSLAAHRLMGGGGFNVAEAVTRYYAEAGWPDTPQTQTDWWRPVRTLTGDTSSAFEPVARILVDHGYLIPVDAPRRGRGTWFRANRALPRRGATT